MMNAIRIILGLIMAFLAASVIFSIVTFSIAYQSQSPFKLESLLGAVVLIGLPTISAWLLLFPKSQKQFYVGLTIAILFISFILVDQIL